MDVTGGITFPRIHGTMISTAAADPAVDPAALLDRQLAAAARRWRLELFSRALGRIVLALAVGFAAWALLAALLPSTAQRWPVGLLMAGGILVLAAAECRLREPDWPRIRRGVDRRLGLPDTILTAAELRAAPPAASAEWARHQLTQAAETLRRVDWKTAWPVRAPRVLAPAVVVMTAALAFLGWRAAAWEISRRLPPPTAREQETAQALRALLDDWDKSQREQPDEDLKKLLAELQPLRDRLAQPGAALDEHEAFQQLSRIEEKLAAIQAKLDAQSLQPFAADLAAALEKVDGLGALAANLRKGDFEGAEKEAEKAAKQMREAGAKLPQGTQAAEAAEHLAKLAQQAGEKGNQGTQQSASQMQSGLQKNDPGQMAQGLQKLQQQLANQNAREAQRSSLSHQLRQMTACKNGLTDGEGLARNLSMMPSLTAQRQRQPGKGAGSETDLHRNGTPTELAAGRNRENLHGTTNEQGETDTTNVSTNDPTGERTRATGTANFKNYEQLSQQAVADESIPLAHRQTIRRYFEAIRPANEKP